jgi:hypothetical protein
LEVTKPTQKKTKKQPPRFSSSMFLLGLPVRNSNKKKTKINEVKKDSLAYTYINKAIKGEKGEVSI